MADFDPDESFAELLAQYDAILAFGHPDGIEETTPDAGPDQEIRQRVDQAKDCLRFLEKVWPRSQADVIKPPRSVGRFQIIRELGRGGFGVVYLARDEKLSRLVALKLQRPEAIVSPPLRSRFIQEARAAGSLRHANVATVYEVGEAGVRIWIASEYCDGGSLANWLSAVHPTASAHSVAVFMSALADALEYSHQQGVLHRDLKPSNVLLQRTTDLGTSNADDLSNYVPKLIDFGLAKTDEGSGQDTRTGALIGTPAYMAPEQANGRSDLIVAATDVYGLGLLLYELLTGRPAFVGESDLAILTKVGNGDFVQPHVLRRELPRDLEAICLKCLQTKSSERYPSAGALAADLRRFMLGKQTLARPLTAAQRSVQWSRRRPAVAALLGVSLLGSLLLVAMTTLYVTRLREARDATDSARQIAEQNALESKQHEAISEKFLYSSRIALAIKDLEAGNSEDAELRLASYAKNPALTHLRGFEWHYLQRRLHDDALTLEGHDGEVYAVQFSPDDRFAVSGGQDGTIRFWEKSTGTQHHQIQAHASCVNSLSYSADGERLASGGCDGMVHIWDAATLQLSMTLRDHPPVVECVAFSPASADRLATSGNDPIVRVWDLTTGLLAQSFDTRASSVKAVVWSRDGQAIYIVACHSQSTQNMLIVWKPNEDLVESINVVAQSIALSPATDELSVGLMDATIRSFQSNIVTHRILAGHQRRVDALAFSADGAWLASGSDDAYVRLWDVAKGDYLRTLSGHTARVQALTFDRHGSTLASASYDHTVRLWNLSSASQQMLPLSLTVQYPVALVQRIALSPDLRRVAALTTPTRLEIRDFDSHKVLASADVPPSRDFQFSEDGESVVANSLDGKPRLYIWKDNLRSTVEVPLPFAGAYLANADASYMFGQDADVAVILQRATGKEIFRRDWPAIKSTKLKCMATLSPNRQVFGVYVESLGKSCILRPGQANAVKEIPGKLWAFNDDGSLALVEHNPRLSSFELIETVTGRQIAILTDRARINHLVFSPDSKTIASGGTDGKVRLWNVATGQETAQLATHSGDVAALQFSSDSRALAAIVEDPLVSKDIPSSKSVRVFVWSGKRETGIRGQSTAQSR